MTAGLMAFLFLGLAILVIVWIILPFAILGTKPLLRELIAEQRRTNELLRARGGDTPDRLAPGEHQGRARRDYPPT